MQPDTPSTPQGPQSPGSDPRPGAAEPSAPVSDTENGTVVPAKLPPSPEQPRRQQL
jgi:hypothetical protein